MEREDQLVNAALAAFTATFAGARVVERELALGDGPAWSWLAELADGGLCAVRVVDEAGAQDVWSTLDALAQLDEREPHLRAAFGLGALDERRAVRAALIAQHVSSGYARRAALASSRRLQTFELVRMRTRERSRSMLTLRRDCERYEPGDEPRGVRSDGSRTNRGDEGMFAALRERMGRLDPLLEVEQDGEAEVFRVHGHEVARVSCAQDPPTAQAGPASEVLALDGPLALESFLARVVERYLELGCWAGADGGPASLALVEPLLTHEEAAAFRELA